MNCSICEAHVSSHSLLPPSFPWILRDAPTEKGLEGYLYLETRRHVESFFQVSPSEWESLGKGMEVASGLLMALEPKPEKLYWAVFAEKVHHFHIHLVPRYAGQDKGIPHLEQALGVGFLHQNPNE